jgi:polyvinyl alcohol dehydrogenase (cytochrome)
MLKYALQIILFSILAIAKNAMSEPILHPSKSANCKELKGLKFDPKSTNNWNGWGNGLTQSRHQNFDQAQINIANISELKLKWVFGFPGAEKQESQPTVFGGIIFTGGGKNKIYAVDSLSGCVVWERSVVSRVRSTIQVGIINDMHILYFGDVSGVSYALSASDGKLLWQKKIDSHPAAQLTGSAVFYDGVVYFPVASWEEASAINSSYPCCTFRGSVVAQNGLTGEILWKSYTIPNEPQKSNKNYKGVQNFGPSGAAIWSSPVIDIKNNALYVTTGNNYSYPSDDNSDSFIAFDLKNGKLLWKKQITSNDATNMSCYEADSSNCPSKASPDHDFSSSPILVTTENRRLLISGQKSGIVTALDPDDNGKILWQKKVAKGGSLGGIQWGSAVSKNLVLVPISDLKTAPVSASTPGAQKGELGWFKFSKSNGGLVALDILTGEIKWSAKTENCDFEGCSTSNSAAVTALDDLVFSGSVDGHLRAYDLSNGSKLWDVDTKINMDGLNGFKAFGGSLDGPGVTVANGMLFVKSGYRMFGGIPGNALLAFSISP